METVLHYYEVIAVDKKTEIEDRAEEEKDDKKDLGKRKRERKKSEN